MSDYTIQITSNRPHLAKEAIESLKPLKANHFNGEGYSSCAQLWNHAIADAKTEIVIISSDKSRARLHHVNKMVKLINDGFGWVTFCSFGFFGFHKDVIRRVGFFDERIMGGNYEDCDFARRLKMADIGVYESWEVSRVDDNNGWGNSGGEVFYFKKWDEVNRQHNKKLLPEEKYNYNIGESKNIPFKKWHESESDWENEHSLVNGWFNSCKFTKEY